MTEWLKRFALSMFSDSKAKDSVKFGFGNVLLTSFLAFVFIFLGLFAGKMAPFNSYYNGADEFRNFVYNAFGKGISLTANGTKAEIALNGGNADIDTLADEGDGAVYYVNGYHLFVNTACIAETYDDFEAYCINTEDNTEIGYEDYLSRPEAERKNYRFAVRYTGRIKSITEEVAASCAEYLQELNDEDINSALSDLEKSENYAESVYRLYVRAYYPDMINITGEEVPTLRNYYYMQTLKTDGKYLCLFGDMVVASFKTYNGNAVSFGGLYKQGNDIAVGAGHETIDGFIKTTFYGASSMTFLLDLMNSIYLIIFIVLILVSVMLFGFVVCKLRKKGSCLKFSDSAKIVASYAHVSALISAVITLCLSFAYGGKAVLMTAYISFAVILVIRTSVLLLREKFVSPKEEQQA